MSDDSDFLSRWSKRKARVRQEADEEAAAADEDQLEAPEAEAGLDEASEDIDEAGDPDDHPAVGIDIDKLDRNSDYSVFLNPKVPAELRHQALQKLWLSDPVYANLDGLAEYDLDYTDKALVVKGLKVAYDQARRRMLAEEAEAAEEKAEAEEQLASAEPEDDVDAEQDADEPEVAGGQVDLEGEADGDLQA